MTKASIILDSSESFGACLPALQAPGVATISLRHRLMAVIGKYLKLAKPGIVAGNLVSVLGGFLLASRGHVDVARLLITALGVSLVIGSGCVFNNYIDRDIDQKMRRTQKRILVQGDLPSTAALAYACFLGCAGTFLLAHFVNILSAGLVFIGFTIYVGVYSLYMKRHSVFGTLVGSFSGALPPVIGYCAVSGHFAFTRLRSGKYPCFTC